MNSILIIGAGRSSTILIRYLLEKAAEFNWTVTVADANLLVAEKKVDGHPNGSAVRLDILDEEDRRMLVSWADVVVSMLPHHLHIEVARDCIKFKKHLITASYISKEMHQLHEVAEQNELVFMGEMGLDPGIDHMSAMQKIDDIRASGGKLTAFRSYTGGLVAPESDDNPWHYKFTWNPRNVILAGQGTAQYLEDGKYKYIPYNRLFKKYRIIEVPGMGEYEVYANRDSLLYREVYGLEGIPDILRGTIRCRGFCEAWNALVRIGLTDGSYPIVDSGALTYHDLLEAYTSADNGRTLEEKVADLVQIDPDSEVIQKLKWMGLFDHKKIEISNASPAQILEHLLLDKWKLQADDKDMIIMQHEFEYELDGDKHLDTSTLVLKGNHQADTAMARLVGLPIAILTKLVMTGYVVAKGVNIPVMKNVYEPVLEELKEYGVHFVEQESIKISG